MAAAKAQDNFLILQYDYIPDILEKRGPYREGHLAAAKKLKEEVRLTPCMQATFTTVTTFEG